MKALLFKQIVLSKAVFCSLAVHSISAVAVAAFTIGIVSFIGQMLQQNNAPLELKLEKYGKTVVIYGNNNQYVQQYVEIVKMTGSEPKESNNVTGSLLSVGEHDPNTYYKKYIVAADFGNNVTALYSPVADHSLPISLNLIMNSLLRSQGNTIELTSHPLNTQKDVTEVEIIQGIGFIFTTYELMYVTSIFIIRPIAERLNKAKELHYVSGVSPLIYWLSYFLWDFLLYMVIIVFMLLVVLIFDGMRYFSGVKEIARYATPSTHHIREMPGNFEFIYHKMAPSSKFKIAKLPFVPVRDYKKTRTNEKEVERAWYPY